MITTAPNAIESVSITKKRADISQHLRKERATYTIVKKLQIIAR